MVSDLLFGTIR